MRPLPVVAVCLGMVFAKPAAAQSQDPNALAADGLEKLMRAMELFIGTIPIYEAPEVLPNGDIIIRRVPPTTAEDPRWKRPDGETDDETDEERWRRLNRDEKEKA